MKQHEKDKEQKVDSPIAREMAATKLRLFGESEMESSSNDSKESYDIEEAAILMKHLK